MINLKKQKEDALDRFEEERENYNLTTYDDYIDKLNKFNDINKSGTSNEYLKKHKETVSKINDLKNEIETETKEQLLLEDSLKFELAEKKEVKITELKEELNKFKRRLDIVKNKIDEELEINLSKAGEELYVAALNYKNELELIVDKAREDLQERKRKIFAEESNFGDKYLPINYARGEIESQMIKIKKYVKDGK